MKTKAENLREKEREGCVFLHLSFFDFFLCFFFFSSYFVV